MNNISRALAITLMAATIPATVVLAQQAPTGDQTAVEKPAVEKNESRRGPSPETIARLEDGRIAFAKAALKLTPDQDKLWAPVEEKIRAGFAERQKTREEWKAKRDERRAEREAKDEKGNGEKLALPDRIEKRSERMTKQAERLNERAAKVKEFGEVLKPLYASFTPEQQAVAGKVLGQFVGKGHGSRWAMHRGFGGKGHGERGGRDFD